MDVKKPLRTPGKIARLREWFRKKSLIKKIFIVLGAIWLLAFIFAERSIYGIVFLTLRIYAPIVVVCGLFLWGLYRMIKKMSKKGRVITLICLVLFISLDALWFNVTPWGMYDYVSSYRRYQTIPKVSLSMLPETDHESVQPIITMQTVANQQIQTTSIVSRPFLIRDSVQYKWTSALLPNTFWQRLFDNVTTVYNVPSEISSLDFSRDNQSAVSFGIAENLFLSCQAHTATLRKLSFLDLFSYDVGEPRFMKDDVGEWVQVVPLIIWRGILFPQPEFGGVNIIHQSHRHDLGNMITRFLFGSGEIYSPQQMKQFRYLQNQNLMPREVILSIAHSFRFQKGFWAPMPSNHEGDTRIPVIEKGDVDEQPLTAFFKMSKVAQANDMLYEYIGLQPFDTVKDGLVASLFIPSDGEMVVYIYNHDQKKDGIIGATAVPSRVRELRQSIDWNESKITAIRPYNRIINGTMYSFWRASIVTRSKHGDGWVSGITSEIAFIDLRSQRIMWISPENPTAWIEKIKAGTP